MPSPFRTGLILLIGDLVVIFLTFVGAIWLRYLYDRSLIWEIYYQLWPGLFAFVIVYSLLGLYPGIGMIPPEELRRLTYGTSLVMIVLGASTFMFEREGDYSRGAFVFAWLLLLFAVPLVRGLARAFFARKPWWGVGIIVLGAGQTAKELIVGLSQRPALGFKPQAIFDDDPNKKQTVLEGVGVLGSLEQVSEFTKSNAITHAVIAMPGVPRQRLIKILEKQDIPHLILIPDLFGLSSLWVSTQDLGGMLGLEIRQRLLLPGSRLTKRALDLALVVLFAVPTLLLIGFLALLIRLDSKGSVFYIQERLGVGGKRFRVLKFRSMYGDGEERLLKLLEEDPVLREEYERFHKLKNDPRVTRIGKFLRITSLDELPQLWNVLRGEMSLVGPRAYLPRELSQMQGVEPTILKVLPGLTGLWQVSGRNRLPFEERLNLDSYYVRNWSVWLDLYILARTVSVVLFAKDAY